MDLLSYYKDNYIVDADKNIYKLDEEYSTCVIRYRNSENNYPSIIAPFVINSYGSGYINNKVFATIRQSGTPSEMDIYPYVAAGLVGKMTIGELYSAPVCYNAIEGLIYTSGIEVGIIGLTDNSSNIFDKFNKMDIMTNKKTKFVGKEIDQNLFFSILKY